VDVGARDEFLFAARLFLILLILQRTPIIGGLDARSDITYITP
jgi:hypothetical protein